MANMAILATIDLSYHGRVWPRVELGHARVASVAIGVTALATLAVLTPVGVSIGWVGIDTVAVAGAYAAAVAWICRSPVGQPGEGEVLPTPIRWTRPERGSLRPTVARFVAASGLVLAAAPLVAWSGRDIASASGLGETFVGSALLAISASLPELVTSLAAVRIGAHDLAVGNLFGSNAVNMALLVVVDSPTSGDPCWARSITARRSPRSARSCSWRWRWLPSCTAPRRGSAVSNPTRSSCCSLMSGPSTPYGRCGRERDLPVGELLAPPEPGVDGAVRSSTVLTRERLPVLRLVDGQIPATAVRVPRAALNHDTAVHAATAFGAGELHQQQF